MQANRMNLERPRASISVPDEGALQEHTRQTQTLLQSDKTSHDRRAKELCMNQTNQRLEDVTSEPPPTSLGLEEWAALSVHDGSLQTSIQICKVETKRGIFEVDIPTTERQEQSALKQSHKSRTSSSRIPNNLKYQKQ